MNEDDLIVAYCLVVDNTVHTQYYLFPRGPLTVDVVLDIEGACGSENIIPFFMSKTTDIFNDPREITEDQMTDLHAVLDCSFNMWGECEIHPGAYSPSGFDQNTCPTANRVREWLETEILNKKED